MKMIKFVMGTAALAFLSLQPAHAAMDHEGMTTKSFVTMASQSDEFEITEGKVAVKKGSPDVRAFGEKMVKDHTMTTDTLHAAIKKAGMGVPPPPALRADQREMVDKLEGLSGKAFDRAYLKQQLAAHRQTLAFEEEYAKAGETPAIRMAAEKTVPIIKEHIRIVEKLEKEMSS